VAFSFVSISHHPAYIPFVVVSFLSLLIGGVWSIYCYGYLDKIDMGKMDIRTFSLSFLRFRRWEKWEWCVKFIAILLIITTGFYAAHMNVLAESTPYVAGYIVGYSLTMLLAAAIGFLIYRQFYWKNLKKVDAALKEIEELQ